jgi:vancomycin resistance protein VanJ
MQTLITNTPRVRFATAVRLLAAVYVLAILGFYAAQSSPFGETWLVQLISVFAPWVYLPLPALLLLAVLVRGPRLLVLLLVPLACFAMQYGPRFLPGSIPPQQPTLRVMTWNVLFTNDDVQGVLHTIEQQDPDVLALQELGTAIAPALAEHLASEYPYQALAPRSNPDGFGIFSRYPILRADAPALASSECRCQRVDILVDGQTITLFNVHPHIPALQAVRVGPLPVPTDFSTKQQDPSFQALLRQLDGAHGPTLVVGDLNTTDQQPNYHLLRARFADSFGKAGFGFGFTFPRRGQVGPLPAFPVVRLDYIFHDDSWQTDAVWTGAGRGSDHGYVLAALSRHRASPEP